MPVPAAQGREGPRVGRASHRPPRSPRVRGKERPGTAPGMPCEGKGPAPPAPAARRWGYRTARMSSTRHGQCRNSFQIPVRCVRIQGAAARPGAAVSGAGGREAAGISEHKAPVGRGPSIRRARVSPAQPSRVALLGMRPEPAASGGSEGEPSLCVPKAIAGSHPALGNSPVVAWVPALLPAVRSPVAFINSFPAKIQWH